MHRVFSEHSGKTPPQHHILSYHQYTCICVWLRMWWHTHILFRVWARSAFLPQLSSYQSRMLEVVIKIGFMFWMDELLIIVFFVCVCVKYRTYKYVTSTWHKWPWHEALVWVFKPVIRVNTQSNHLAVQARWSQSRVRCRAGQYDLKWYHNIFMICVIFSMISLMQWE